jgi:pyruvate/2-oxoglutarate dehydrogenase complex dihydrolipoamide acyltransferase (E2) component
MEGQIEQLGAAGQPPAETEQKPQQPQQPAKVQKKQPAPKKQPAAKKPAPAAGEKKAKKDEIRLKKEFNNTTPKGEKKDMTQPMLNEYDPPAVEAAWYDWWAAQGFFRADENDQTKEKFIIVIPAAERHRQLAHGSRPDQLHPGRSVPMAPNERQERPLGSGHGPRRHCHAGRC